MPPLIFEPCDLPDEAEALRGEVRAFLAEELADYPSRNGPIHGLASMGNSPAIWARVAGWA